MRIGVVADDVTGANDIGSMFVKGGCSTNVFSLLPDECGFMDFTAYAADVVVLDTNSRLDSAQIAYQKVFDATRALKAGGCRQFHNKTCSVFRGNIGAEFDAMLDVLDTDFAVVVLGFPKNGRGTAHGVHYVHGKKLEESEFRHDPIHPMRQSNLVDILQAQTRRKVDGIAHEVIAQGADALRSAIDQKRSQCSYLILDVIDQSSLTIIAEAVRDEPVLCGSSALGEELPQAWGVQPAVRSAPVAEIDSNKGILITAGSLTPQTAAQIEYFHQTGKKLFALEADALFDAVSRIAYLNALTGRLVVAINSGHEVVLHSQYHPAQVAQTRQDGLAYGLSPVQVARLISETLADVTQQVLKKTEQRAVIVAGGETSAAVCRRLRLFGFRVGDEIAPGLPSCFSLTIPPYALVLKSGSFGKAEFFEQAINHLRRL